MSFYICMFFKLEFEGRSQSPSWVPLLLQHYFGIWFQFLLWYRRFWLQWSQNRGESQTESKALDILCNPSWSIVAVNNTSYSKTVEKSQIFHDWIQASFSTAASLLHLFSNARDTFNVWVPQAMEVSHFFGNKLWLDEISAKACAKAFKNSTIVAFRPTMMPKNFQKECM